MKKRRTNGMATRVSRSSSRSQNRTHVKRTSGSMARQRSKSRGIGRWVLLALVISASSVYLMRNGAENFKRIFAGNQDNAVVKNVEENLEESTIVENEEAGEEEIVKPEPEVIEESIEQPDLQASLIPNDSTINEITNKWWDIKPLKDRAFKVRNIKISGNFSVSEELIMASIGDLENTPMSEIDLAELEARIESHPRIKDAIVSKIVPSTITCRIIERVEFATIIVDGMPLGIDEYAMLLSLPPEGWDQHHPLITGFDGRAHQGSIINDEQVLDAIQWLKEAEKLPRVWNWISEVYLNKGRIEIVGGDKGSRVLTGDHAKHIQLAALDAMLVQNGAVEEIGMLIDLTFPKFLIIRPVSG